ncbi:MAG: NAD(P)/FAD-dependent oxidoreductase [Thermoplasmata archaeon]|nr:NAD(P)/FAD-dependent oxidoreductase [Thermoplasmata archaeon]
MALEYDVLVVGAGPAGSTAARYAAESGASVLLVEKRQGIGTPVRCGEGISKRWLEEIGLEPSGRWIAHEVDGARIFSPDGSFFEVDEKLAGNECGYVIERDLFDRDLAKRAISSGAELTIRTSAIGLLHENGQVAGARLRSFGKTLDVNAKIVIGADGYESQVGRWAGIETTLKPRDIDSCFQYTLVGIEGDCRFNHFYLGSYAPGGYIWVFWKGKDIANVGIGVQLNKIREKGMARRLLDDFISKREELSKGKVIEQVSGAFSICAPIERTTTDGVMLVGDAARVTDPVTGGGIHNACVLGKFAGLVAAEAVESADTSAPFLAKYERLWRDRLEETLYRNWMIKEKLTTYTDERFNRIFSAISDYDWEKLSVLEILTAVREKCPELQADVEAILGM